MIIKTSRTIRVTHWMASMCLGVALSVTGCDRPVEPAVFATPATYRAGTIWNQTDLERAFTVVNTTSRDVAITLSQTSCGCASLELSSKSIPAGGQIRAALRATLGGRTGPQQFVATLYTDHEAFPVVQLQMTAEVGFSQIDGILPIDLGLFHPGEAVNRLITIPEGHDNARLIDCQESPGGSLHTAVDDATEFRIRLTGETPRRPGPFALKATATASGGFWTSRDLELRGRVVPDWQFPERVGARIREAGEHCDPRDSAQEDAQGDGRSRGRSDLFRSSSVRGRDIRGTRRSCPGEDPVREPWAGGVPGGHRRVLDRSGCDRDRDCPDRTLCLRSDRIRVTRLQSQSRRIHTAQALYDG